MTRETCYRIGGIPVSVRMTGDDVFTDDSVLLPFAEPAATVPAHRYDIICTDTLPKPAGNCIYHDPAKRVYLSDDGKTQTRYVGAVGETTAGAYLCIQRNERETLVQYKGTRITTKTVLSSLEAEHLITVHAGILLHASCIRYENRAILFTAPSGTGKSTQADLWSAHRHAELINGDRAAVFAPEIETNGVIRVRGIPYAGSSGVARCADLPLWAIVYLSQAKENTVRRLTGQAAFRAVWEGCSVNTWSKDDVTAAADTVMRLVSGVPVLSLACTKDVRAVETLEHALETDRKGVNV